MPSTFCRNWMPYVCLRFCALFALSWHGFESTTKQKLTLHPVVSCPCFATWPFSRWLWHPCFQLLVTVLVKILVQDMLLGVGGGTWKTPIIKSSRARRGGVVGWWRRSGQKVSVLVCARFCILLWKQFDRAYNTILRINKKSLPSSDGFPVRSVEIAPFNRDYLLRETYCTDLIVFLS